MESKHTCKDRRAESRTFWVFLLISITTELEWVKSSIDIIADKGGH